MVTFIATISEWVQHFLKNQHHTSKATQITNKYYGIWPKIRLCNGNFTSVSNNQKKKKQKKTAGWRAVCNFIFLKLCQKSTIRIFIKILLKNICILHSSIIGHKSNFLMTIVIKSPVNSCCIKIWVHSLSVQSCDLVACQQSTILRGKNFEYYWMPTKKYPLFGKVISSKPQLSTIFEWNDGDPCNTCAFHDASHAKKEQKCSNINARNPCSEKLQLKLNHARFRAGFQVFFTKADYPNSLRLW